LKRDEVSPISATSKFDYFVIQLSPEEIR